MKKQLLVLFTVAVTLLSSCGKDEKVIPSWNENLEGKKFRAKAWYNNDGYGQIYDVFEFTSGSKVINEYRLSNDKPVNKDHRVILDWKKDGVTKSGIIVQFRRFTDPETQLKEQKGIVTDGLLSFPGKVGETVYEEY